MASGLSRTQVEAWKVVSEQSRGGIEALRNLARDASALAERFSSVIGRVEELGSAAVAPEPQAGDSIAVPLLLEFARQSRSLGARHELPSLLASSASRLAPRVLLFA